MKAIQTSEIVAIIFAFLFLAMVLLILARRKLMRNGREGKEGMFTRENSTSSQSYFIDDSSGVRMVTLVDPRLAPNQETTRRAHEFRERARRPPNLIRDTNGTECESIPPLDADEIDLESLEDGNHDHHDCYRQISEDSLSYVGAPDNLVRV